MGENKVLWVLQVLLGIQFVAIGILHFIVPEDLPAAMEWMYDLSDTLHMVSGAAEILGGLSLILSAATRIMPHLTVLAAAGLTAYVGYRRWRREPITARRA